MNKPPTKAELDVMAYEIVCDARAAIRYAEMKLRSKLPHNQTEEMVKSYQRIIEEAQADIDVFG